MLPIFGSYLKSALFLFMLAFQEMSGSNAAGQVPDPEISRIIIQGDSVIRSEGLNIEQMILDFRHHNIAFELVKSDSVVYQYFLDGFDEKWSPETQNGFKEYTNLPPGEYFFNVRYLRSETTGEVMLFQFKVRPPWYSTRIAISFYVMIVILGLWFIYASLNLRFAKTQHLLEQIINKRTEDMIAEKDRSEKLLANVLPKTTASEIMEKGKATKIKYNFVTVLFSDIQGFTKIAEETNPEILIDELDKFFFHFDSVVERLGIEKIKTIGDAYMCAGGIPEKNRTNPVEVILAALEMQEYMKKLKALSELEGMKFWDIRIGIHTGSVVAGVVGQKKLSYDIWGDTVNTASRMESSGEAGKINISGTTYEFVKEFFICEHRGKMPVKYKGELDMYFVNGIVPELSGEDGMPNKRFIIKMQMIKLQDIEELIIKKFDDEAPIDLYFHNSALVKNICNQTELLATAENVTGEENVILKLAAIFLFAGFINDYDNPSGASCELVDETLPGYGFDDSISNLVKEMIRKSYENRIDSLSDRILHDARYDYIGRVDYIKMIEKLIKEETEYGRIKNREDWVKTQKELIVKHQFLSETAQMLRSVPEQDQIKLLSEAYGKV